jgi:hypothetical protein
MLLLHNLMFWSGLALFVHDRRWRPVTTVVAVLGVGLLPPVFTALGTIWKDVGMGAAMLLACAVLARAARRRSLGLAFAALAPLFYAAGVRHDAATAVLPVALWAGAIAAARLGWSRRGAAALLGLALFVALTVLASATNRTLAGPRRLFAGQNILLHDLAAVSLAADQMLIPPQVGVVGPPSKTLSTADLACLYDPAEGVILFHGHGGLCRAWLDKIKDQEIVQHLRRTWAEALAAHPLAYLAHRARVLASALGLDGRRTCYPLAVGHDPNDLGYVFRRTTRYDLALAIAAAFAYLTPLFKGWLYVLVLAACVVLALTRVGIPRDDRVVVLAVAASGLAYALARFVIGVSCHFRMNWWPLLAACVVVLLLCQARSAGARLPSA